MDAMCKPKTCLNCADYDNGRCPRLREFSGTTMWLEVGAKIGHCGKWTVCADLDVAEKGKAMHVAVFQRIAQLVYETARLEAWLMDRRIPAEPWWERDEDFRQRFCDKLTDILTGAEIPDPEKAHEEWVKEHKEKGWTYGPKLDLEAKTHPNMVPYDQLPAAERERDAVFLAIVQMARNLLVIYASSDE